jgi:hypothetical protein
MTARTATGVEGAGVGCRLSRGTAGTSLLMPREKHKRRKPRGESTDAGDWDGPARISDEGAVMELE